MSKTANTSSSASKSKFYELPATLNSSAKVIADAKDALIQDRQLLKFANSKRPETPIAVGRTITVCSESSVENDASKPPTRLSPIRRNSANKFPPHPPPKRQPFSHLILSRSSSLREIKLPEITGNASEIRPGSRRVVSGPKERTSPLVLEEKLLEERGQGDGKEASPRTISRNTDNNYCGSSPKRIHDNEAFQDDISPILDKISKNCVESADFIKNIQLLYNFLDESEQLNRSCPHRSKILKLLFGHLSVDCRQATLQILRVILALRVSGTNLLNAFKVLYKLSRDETNDAIFLSSGIFSHILVSISDCDVTEHVEQLVYGLGAVKCLATNQEMCQLFIQNNAVQIVSKHLADLLNPMMSTNRSQQHRQLLVQIMGAVRNFAEIPEALDQFVSFDLSNFLLSLLTRKRISTEVVLLVSRTLSKISTHPGCSKSIVGVDQSTEIIIHQIDFHNKNPDILRRLLFVLSNFVQQFDLVTRVITANLETFVQLFYQYLHLVVHFKKTGDTEIQPDASKNFDTLGKIVTVLTNISVTELSAISIATNEDVIDLLVTLLESMEPAAEDNFEITVNSLCLLNNLTFYVSENSDTSLTQKLPELTLVIVPFLYAETNDIVVRAFEVISNLSRIGKIRQLLCSNKVVEVATTLLDSTNAELIYAVLGTLINLLVENECKTAFRLEQGADKAYNLLKRFSNLDWSICGLVCQVLFNLSSNITSASSCYGSGSLAENIIDFLELLNETETFDCESSEVIFRNQFLPVSVRLKDKIMAYMSHFEPL